MYIHVLVCCKYASINFIVRICGTLRSLRYSDSTVRYMYMYVSPFPFPAPLKLGFQTVTNLLLQEVVLLLQLAPSFCLAWTITSAATDSGLGFQRRGEPRVGMRSSLASACLHLSVSAEGWNLCCSSHLTLRSCSAPRRVSLFVPRRLPGLAGLPDGIDGYDEHEIDDWYSVGWCVSMYLL